MSPADTRAHAWCNLGELAPGESSIGDDHVQGTGLVMVKGTIRLLGVVRPVAGTVVELAYSDGQNWLARLPRRLRVLSSFTNPLGTPITTVSVGCDLAYVESRKPVVSNPTNKEATPTVPEAARRAATPPIPAAWLVGNILQAVGITAAGACPLTNEYNLDEFDMSEGYVQELGKLLDSEGYFARVNDAGLLEYISKDQDLQPSIVLLEDDLIEISPVNIGELPGDGVYARFTTKRFKAPGSLDDNERAKRNWESDETISGTQLHVHRWTTYERVPVLDASGNSTFRQARDRDGNLLYYSASGNPVMEQVYETRAVQREERINYRTISRTRTEYDGWDRVTTRTTVSIGLWGIEISQTSYNYKRAYSGLKKPTDYSDVESDRTVTYSPKGAMMLQLGANGSFFEIYTSATHCSAIRETFFYKNQAQGTTRTVSRSWGPYVNTQDGGETISRMREAGVPLENIYSQAIQLIEAPSSTNIRTEREYGLQRRPPEAARLSDANLKAPEVEEVATIAWQMGSPASLTSIELSPPYVSDDRFSWSGSAWVVTSSDAPQKALHYARVENRLRLGHRNGLSLQLLPEQVPPAPFGLIYIRLAGCTAAYRVNGTTYNISPQGCVATTDALFWGAIDSSGAAPWFPMPPGAVALPTPVAITTNANPLPPNAIAIPAGFNPHAPNLASLFAALPVGQGPIWGRAINPSALVRPYWETVDLALGVGGGITIDQLPWVAADPVDLLVGIGAGIEAPVPLMVGLGAGIVISTGAVAGMVPLLTAIPVDANILDSANLDPAQGQSLPYFWSTNPLAEPAMVIVGFTLAQPITIVAVGMYDHQQNGLAQVHGFALFTFEDLQPVSLNYGASGSLQVPIPAGTAATLLGSYRVVPLASPQILAAGQYWMGATMPSTGADAIAAIPEGSGVWNAAVNNPSNNSPTTTGWQFLHVVGNNPQVSFDALYDEATDPNDLRFAISGNNKRVPIGPMLFVAG